MKIGVFDSGVGGKSVANALEKALPEHEIIYVQDHDNIPYGNKTPEVLYGLVLPLLNKLSNDGCQIIVIACNSVSTTIFPKLQEQIKAKLIPVEPMIEQAQASTKSGIITVCATPLTLSSSKYGELKKQFAPNSIFLEPDCSQWAYLIETQQIDRQIIKNTVVNSLQQGSDVIVLGCTHYHWIEDDIRNVSEGKAVIIQPEQDIIHRVKQEIEQLG